MSGEFATATRARERAPGEYDVDISERYTIGRRPHGGYLMALAARVLADTLPPADPIALTAHFLRPPATGPAVVRTATLRAGRRFATGTATLEQDGRAALHLTGLCGDLAAAQGPTRLLADPPAFPALDDCIPDRSQGVGDMPIELRRRVEMRFVPETAGWIEGRTDGPPEIAAWIRLADAEPADLFALILLTDALPPVPFTMGLSGWAPTLDLTVHLRAHPAQGWLRVRHATRFVTDGFMEEDCEIWDAEDRLVAHSRQLLLAPADAL